VPRDRDLLARLCEVERLTTRQIADRFGVSGAAVRHVLWQFGLKAPRGPRGPYTLRRKRCGRCGQEKTLRAFAWAMTGIAHASWCRACHRAYDLARKDCSSPTVETPEDFDRVLSAILRVRPIRPGAKAVTTGPAVASLPPRGVANTLPPAKREALAAAFACGLGVRATARALGIASGTVTSYLREHEQRMGAPVLCGCGRPVRQHRGMCDARYAMAPKRQATVRGFRRHHLRIAVSADEHHLLLAAAARTGLDLPTWLREVGLSVARGRRGGHPLRVAPRFPRS
jgi:DNA-directed RNA polymerase specialized sigma24 family protein